LLKYFAAPKTCRPRACAHPCPPLKTALSIAYGNTHGKYVYVCFSNAFDVKRLRADKFFAALKSPVDRRTGVVSVIFSRRVGRFATCLLKKYSRTAGFDDAFFSIPQLVSNPIAIQHLKLTR